MRLVKYADGDCARWGTVGEDGHVHHAEGTLADGFREGPSVGDLRSLRLLAPVEPRTVVAVGRNYAEHARELGNEPPTTPFVFLKPASAIVGPGAEIISPSVTALLHHEAELAVVIGRRARNVNRQHASSVIFGYTLANDVTARDLQRSPVGLTLAKAFDTFCPVGPWIDTEVDATALRVQAEVDGELRQDASVADMLFPIPVLIEFVTRFMTLEPGDLLLTGTPSGVGPLLPGSSVTVRSPGLGFLTNRVVGESPTAAGSGGAFGMSVPLLSRDEPTPR